MYLHIMTLYCILVTEYEHKLSFSTFTSRQTPCWYLIETVLFFSGIYVFAQYINLNKDKKLMGLVYFLMAYFTTKSERQWLVEQDCKSN
jgi:hypothetical protein